MNLEKIAENDSMTIYIDIETVCRFGNKVAYFSCVDLKEEYIRSLKVDDPDYPIRSSYHYEGMDMPSKQQFTYSIASYSENMCEGEILDNSKVYSYRVIPEESLSWQTYEYFFRDWVKKTIEESIPEYEIAARGNYVEAQLSLAEIYLFGKEKIEKDYELAAYWFTQAAEQGHPTAFNDLGNMYHFGMCFEKDQFKAIELYRQAVIAGSKPAMMNYGKHLLRNATSLEQHNEGLNLLTLAADGGYVLAQVNLAMIYVEGQNEVGIDYEKAFHYFQLAAAQGNLEAITGLGMCYSHGNGCEINQEKANEFYKTAADMGLAQAQFNLGWKYHNGIGCEENHEEAFKYYSKAAEQNHPAGLRGVGEIYEMGTDNIPANIELAVEFYFQAAELGDLIAEYNLGVFYKFGTGVEVNKENSAMYLERAASKDHASANLNLGLLYQEGVNGGPDYKKAMSYFNRAAELGNPKAEGCIAVLYQHGLGVEKNTEKAIELFTTCAERGLVHAQYNLSIILSEDDSKYKDIETAFYWLEKAANLDFAPAQKNLSIFLWGGKGSAVDFEEAVKWAFIARHNNEEKADDLINYYEKEVPQEAFIEGFERAKSYLADKG